MSATRETQLLLDEARELTAEGPGRVEVGATTSPVFVRTLRDARSQLSKADLERVADTVGAARMILDEIEPGRGPVRTSMKTRLFRALTLGVSKEAVSYARDSVALASAGGASLVPVGVAVRTALEATAIARILSELTPEERDLLSEPWSERHLSQDY